MTLFTAESAAIFLATLEESPELVEIRVAMVPRSADVAVLAWLAPPRFLRECWMLLLAVRGWQHGNRWPAPYNYECGTIGARW
jgi:hypothetical protein